MVADGGYNQWDAIQLAAKRVVIRGQNITVEIDKKVALMRETINYKFIWKESVETIHHKMKIKVKEEDIQNLYDLTESNREEVAHKERNRFFKRNQGII